MNFKTIDFNNDFWQLRALFVPEVPFIDGQKQDTYIWFLATHDEDLWLSLALSEHADQETATKILDAIDEGEQHALITFVGTEWDLIAYNPIGHSQSMRDIVTALKPNDLARLRDMSSEEIIAIRDSEEKFEAWIKSSN